MKPADFPAPTWLVGCGNMAGAMVEGWRKAGVDLSPVVAIRPSGKPVEGVRSMTSLPDKEVPRFVMLGIKPQKLAEVAPGVAERIDSNTIIVSLLAGVTAETLRAYFPAARFIARAMPNLPVSERLGVTALYARDSDVESCHIVGDLMAALGLAPWCDREEELSTIGAVAGSGPAYVARFAAALAKGGADSGLDPELATQLAIRTLTGTAALLENGESASVLARRVASPAGTTEQGLAVLDAPDGLQPLVDRMLAAAVARGRQLAEDAARRG